MSKEIDSHELAGRVLNVGRLIAFPIVAIAFVALLQFSAAPGQTTAAVYKDGANGTVVGSTASEWGTLTFLSSAETHVLEDDPDTASGTGTELRIESSKKKGDARTLVSFDISTLPGGSDIRAATLSICLSSPPKAATVHELHVLLGEWDEATVTWNTAPAAVLASTDAAVSKKTSA